MCIESKGLVFVHHLCHLVEKRYCSSPLKIHINVILSPFVSQTVKNHRFEVTRRYNNSVEPPSRGISSSSVSRQQEAMLSALTYFG